MSTDTEETTMSTNNLSPQIECKHTVGHPKTGKPVSNALLSKRNTCRTYDAARNTTTTICWWPKTVVDQSSTNNNNDKSVTLQNVISGTRRVTT